MEVTIAMAQINPHVGQLGKNLAMMAESARKAKDLGADLILFPELALTGYPPEDLLLKPLFLERLEEAEKELTTRLAAIGIDAIYGTARHMDEGLANAAVFIEQGVEKACFIKVNLPNYGVFDERRYFVPGHSLQRYTYRGLVFAVAICEDVWDGGALVSSLAHSGVQVVFNLNASPYHMGKQKEREAMIRQHALNVGLPFLYVNCVGGQDELVFDGGSFAMDGDGELALRAPCGEPALPLVRLHGEAAFPLRVAAGAITPALPQEEEIYHLLTLGVGDYVRKNGFHGVVLGLSGGVDSALTAVICADALGAEHVELVMLPSPFTSRESLEDATEVAARLGTPLGEIPIGGILDAFSHELRAVLDAPPQGVTAENIQPRIRATLLMALSNQKGKLLITTGNKSEMSVGYATLYGDMAGGFSVLKDCLKELVYALCHARNRAALEKGQTPPIPDRIIEKPPTAELKPGQKDTDSLPPYPVLDEILRLYVEREKSLAEIVACGIDRQTAVKVIRLVDGNEYKRRQAPPGVKITRRAFGRDRRYPITNGFRVD